MSRPFAPLRPDEDPLDPFTPTTENPFDRRKAAHLLRRSGFGAPAAEVDRALEVGLTTTIDSLVAPRPQDDPFDALQAAVQGTILDFSKVEQVRTWWLYRIQTTRRPLEEKLTLFWHNHFATSISKVDRAEMMFAQNQTFRLHALGRFRDLVLAISKDPAMLIWLDSNTNKKGKPNENYARELLELFTLGQGPYTERDVMEAARAFTGWHMSNGAFEFRAGEHDTGEKTVLGRKGPLDGTDVVDVVLEHPGAAQFIARKIFVAFCHEAPAENLVARLADVFRASGYSISALMKRLLSSKVFFSQAAWRGVVKSPVEFVMGAARESSAQFSLADCAQSLRQMGQDLFNPPTVKGWDGGQEWLNSATVLERMNFAKTLAHARNPKAGSRTAVDEICAREKFATPQAAVAYFLRLHVDDDVPDETRRALTNYLTQDDGEKPRKWLTSGRGYESKVRGLIHLVLSTPEYQLC